jgi:tetratricopeptide (TPR) repeat protein
MAKQHDTQEDVILDVNQTLSKTEQFLNTHKNNIAIIGAVILGVVVLYFGYQYLYLAPKEKEAKEQIWKAQQYFEEDSFRLAIYGDGNYYGFETIVEDYGSTKTGNLARYYLGISYLRIGEFELAIEQLDKFSSSDVMLSAIAKGATGDAYMELGDIEEAAAYYTKASQKKPNDFTTPIYLMKAGLAFEMIGNHKKALEAYKKIQQDYSASQEARSIDKYIARAEGRLANN